MAIGVQVESGGKNVGNLDIIAECMLRVFVTDGRTGQAYEDWLADLMRTEEQNVLDLVHKESPHYRSYFDHEKFKHSLLLRQQSYKAASDLAVIDLIQQHLDPLATNSSASSIRSERASPVRSVQEVAERASRRQSVVNPILKQRGWKPGRLVTEAGLGKNSVYEYLDGTRAKITDTNRKAIAEAIGIPPEQLPD